MYYGIPHIIRGQDDLMKISFPEKRL